MPTPHNPPAAVRRALRKLGADIHDARRRRRLPMAVVAERAFTSRSTLQRVEAGDTNVSVGQALASADLPKHAHLKRPTGSSRDG
jgi:transcriptional regulator with XRE-family HTH domain